jgi:hypothetical protein
MQPDKLEKYKQLRFQIQELIREAYELKIENAGTRAEYLAWYIGTVCEDASDDLRIDLVLKNVPFDQHDRVRKRVQDACNKK